MSDDISVQLTADINQLTDGMDAAATKVNETMDKISGSAEEAGQRLDEGIGQGAQAATEKMQSMGDVSDGLGEKFNDLHSSIMTAFEASGILLAYEALMKVSEALQEAMAHAVQIANMSEVLGISTDHFQALESAAEEAGVGMQMVSRTVLRLEQDFTHARNGITAAENKLFDLGFTLEDINNKAFGTSDQLQVLSNRLRDNATATETMTAFTQAFGARATLVAEVLKNYHGSAADVAEVMAAINGQTKEQVAELQKAHAAWVEFGEAASGAVAHATVKIVEFFGWYKQLVEAKHPELLTAFDEGAAGARRMAVAAEDAAVSIGAATKKVQEQQIKDARETVDLAKAGTLEKVQAEQDYAEALKARYGENNADYQKALEAQTKATEEMNAKNAENATRYAEIQLRAVEKQYASHKAIVEKFYRESMKDATEYFATVTKEQIDVAQGTEKVTLIQLDSAQKILDAQNRLHQIDPQTYLAAELNVINARRDAEIKMYQDIAAARMGDKDSAVKAEQDIAAANAKADEQILSANVKAAEQTQQAWQKLNSAITGSLNTALDGMLQHTATFQQTMRKMFDTLALDFIHSVVDKMVTSWLGGEEAKVSASTTSSAILKALDMSNLATAKVEGTTQAIAQINDSAATGAAAAFASTAAIPVVGPELAPGAAALAESDIMAFMAQVGAAKGGIVSMDMPVNLHQDEMVLPAHISKGIQEAFSGFSQGQGGGAGGGNSNTFNINAHDAGSFKDFLSNARNRTALANAVHKAAQRGNPRLLR